MPLTAADFTTSEAETNARAEGAAQQAPAQRDLIQTPVSEQGAELRAPHPGGLSEQFAANSTAVNQFIESLPIFLQLFARLGEPMARKLDAAARLGQNISIPPKTFGQATQLVSDAGELASAAVAPAAVAGGLAAEAVSRTLGANEDSARWIASAAESFGALGQAAGVGRKVFKEGERMLTGATERALANPSLSNKGLPATTRIGAQMKRLIPKTLARRGDQLGPAIGRIEQEFARTGATVDPNSPLYQRLDNEWTRIAQMGKVEGPAGEQIERIRGFIARNEPLPVAEVVKVKSDLIQPARAVYGSAEPAMSANAAAAYRDTATKTISEMMPRETARKYQAARTLYAREVGRPRKILASAYRDSTSPLQLFNQVFTGNDPYTLKTVAEVSQNSPALKAKLALGYLENMSAATGSWQDARQALQTLKNTRGLVEHTGILNPKELDTLEYFLQRRSLPQVVESFQALVGTMSGAVKGSAATGLAYVASGKPSHMLAALVASGSLSPLRRLMLVPKGSAPWKRAGLVIASNLAKLANEASQASQQPQEGEEELRALMEPTLP